MRNLYSTRIRNLNYYFNSSGSCYVSRTSNATADLMKQVQSVSCQKFLILADARRSAVTVAECSNFLLLLMFHCQRSDNFQPNS